MTEPSTQAAPAADDARPVTAPPTAEAGNPDPLPDHERRAASFRAEVERLEGRAQRISLGRLLSFLAAGVLIAAGVSQANLVMLAAGALTVLAFFGLVIAHARVLQQQQAAQTRCTIHERHIARIRGEWLDLPSRGDGLLPVDHAYGSDIDLVGRGSLFQRIDVTHTAIGERTLVHWLGQGAPAQELASRQRAVGELAPQVELRQELEAAAMGAAGDDKLDHSRFVEFVRRKPFFEGAGWLVPVIHLLPLTTIGLWVGANAAVVPGGLWLLPLLAQTVLMVLTGRATRDAFDLVAARRGYVEAFHRMLVVVERASFTAPGLRERQQRVSIGQEPPSRYLRRLDRWAGLAELRHQFPLNIVANLLLLWDLHVLYRLERWTRDVGPRIEDTFRALGELEAVASLATLAQLDRAATMPDIVDSAEPLQAEGLSHPLLSPDTRVPNDVELRGPGSALIVTGSNMAGKSTLLRAIGVNVALALAGGPVIARAMRVPRVRLRASMRADDSLQSGASYFHAELTKLQRVLEGADEEPPVMFLLDELLRGTNARARHLGARAVLVHLLDRGATGIVATHDVALSKLEQEMPERVANMHFTDVMRDGEMVFDYRLRPGVVQTSNALRLLGRLGVRVPSEE